jgi:hypothetical protein
MWCNYCDPKFFFVFGFCKNCNRRCEPPLYDYENDADLHAWFRMREEWNMLRNDVYADERRRESKEQIGVNDDR